jgi:hypothetical protein
MPKTKVILYCEEDGSCPFLEWIEQLPVKAQDKCLVRVERLRGLGHELRRPEADLLRDGIYELRASMMGIHYPKSGSCRDAFSKLLWGRPSFFVVCRLRSRHSQFSPGR